MALASVVAAYGLMVFSQTQGPAIIEALHGPAARMNATSMDPVLPDSDTLCGDYEDAHWDRISDIWHAAGMWCFVLLPFIGLGLMVSKKQYFRGLIALAWSFPAFYLPAWAGHFFLQKDIPAVFSYGTTLSGWFNGETCAYKALFKGHIVSTPYDVFLSLIMAAVMMVVMVPSAPETFQLQSSKVKKM